MKKLHYLLGAFVVTIAIISATSCSDSEKENPTPVDIQKNLLITALKSNPELSLFTETFQTLDLSASQAAGLTVFALTNTALAETPLTEEVLRRHILEAAYKPSELSELQTVTSLGGAELVVKTTEGMVALNNTEIGLQQAVGNSILYTLDKAIPSYNTYLGLEPQYAVKTYQVQRLRPECIDLDDATFEWEQTFNGSTAIVSTQADYDFITMEAGEYVLTLTATKPSGEVHEFVKTTTLTVTDPEEKYNPFASRIVDFLPAPGQYTNGYGSAGSSTKYTSKQNALNRILPDMEVGKANVYLGTFGGYMVVGFDHTIVNKPGYCDFTTKYGGNNVGPAIIWVAFDANGNGQPDENEWYEIKGSEYGTENDLGMHTYTYQTKPEKAKTIV